MRTHKSLATAVLLTASLTAHAQTQLKGRVLDGSMQGEPLPGAVVTVPGTKAGVLTNVDGEFSLTLPEGKSLVQVSMTGFQTRVVNVRGKAQLVVELQMDDQTLNEVVVVGYGTMRKRDLTGAISQLKGEDLVAGGQADVAKALQGKIAGVQVNQNDGSPGAGVSVTVRGANSFTTSSQPLYIVDGIPYNTNPNATPSSDANSGNNQSTSPLSMLDPNSIEKIEVLKDASATAIYGSRGANGVVIITTKRGAKGDTGRPKVEFNGKWAVSTLGKRVHTLDAPTYALYQNEAAANSRYYEGATTRDPYRGEWTYPYVGGAYVYTQGSYNPSPDDFLQPGLRTDIYGNVDEVAGADWQDEIYQTGFSQDYSLSVSDATDKGWYSFGGNFSQQNGIIKNTGFDRYGLNINIGRHITPWLEVGTSSFFTHTETDFQRTNSDNTGIIRSALIFPATYGPHAQTEQLDELNWLAANPTNYVNGATDRLRQISWFSSSYVEAKLTPWLKFRQNIGLGYNDAHRGTYYDRHTQEGKSPYNGKAGVATDVWRSLTSESLLTADKQWGQHRLNAVVGMTFEKGTGESQSTTATNFPNDYTKYSNLSLALDKPTIKSSETKQTLESFLARLNYTYRSRYMATASLRTDGSSSFAEGNKWAPFFSGALAWYASEETFVKNLNVFSNLKLRLSFGQTGNQAIGAYRTLTVLDAANYPYDGTLSSGYAMIDWRGPTNPDLKWETTDQYDIGIDMGFFHNRLQLTVDYYNKKTRDLLQMVTIPSSTGFSQKLVNSGNVRNEGLEFSVNYAALQSKDWEWDIQANLSFNRNRVGGLSGDQYATSLWSAADQAFLQRNGCPIGTLYGYVEDGFFDNTAEVRAFPAYASLSDAEALKLVGEIKYRDLNGDGTINEQDRTVIGNTNPDFTYGLTSNLRYKRLRLSFLVQGTQGNDILNYNLTDIKAPAAGAQAPMG